MDYSDLRLSKARVVFETSHGLDSAIVEAHYVNIGGMGELTFMRCERLEVGWNQKIVRCWAPGVWKSFGEVRDE